MKTKAHTSIRQFGLLTAACLLAISAQSASAITFVQWPSSAGGNDHFYGITDSTSDWNVAETTAISLGGHLVSITSAEEEAFLVATFLNGQYASLPLWIGLTDVPNGIGSKDYTNWTTGEPVVYTNWNTATNEPNNNPPGEDYGTINWHSSVGGPIGTWNDTPLDGTRGLGGNTDGPYFAIVELNPLNLTAAVSRKIHRAAGTFDIDLPLSGEPGLECRSGGNNGRYTLVFTFDHDVVSGSAAVTSGAGSVLGNPIFSANTMTVNLTGVTDVQTITVSLSSVMDTSGDVLPEAAVGMNVLIGDVTADKAVTRTDINRTRSQVGHPVTSSNFREDVVANGSITNQDVNLVRSHLGDKLLTTLEAAANANIFGAGHAAAPGGGILPPVFNIAPGANRVLTISSVTGSVSINGGGNFNDPDGIGSASDVNVSSTGGISGIINTQAGFLTGIFLDNTEPMDPPPTVLDFSVIGTSFTSLSPVLNQTFFIGDGLTGDGTGTVQQFRVPAGATRLFLGFGDACGYHGSPGCYDDNSGAFTATFSVVGQ